MRPTARSRRSTATGPAAGISSRLRRSAPGFSRAAANSALIAASAQSGQPSELRYRGLQTPHRLADDHSYVATRQSSLFSTARRTSCARLRRARSHRRRACRDSRPGRPRRSSPAPNAGAVPARTCSRASIRAPRRSTRPGSLARVVWSVSSRCRVAWATGGSRRLALARHQRALELLRRAFDVL